MLSTFLYDPLVEWKKESRKKASGETTNDMVGKKWATSFPLDTGLKLNIYKTCRRGPGRLLNGWRMFNLSPMAMGNTYSFEPYKVH